MPFNDKFGFHQVEYQAHYDQFAAPFLIENNEESNRYFVDQAKENHVYGVNNALLELISDALTMLEVVRFTKDADHFLRFGVMRRLRMLMSSFRSFQAIIMPDRVVPLTQEQSDDVCRDLNAIYINILGLLDNYAWVMVHHAGNDVTKAATPMSIGLFKPMVARDPALRAVVQALAPYATWEQDVKTRRNPAAHRMPLYVPPAVYTSEDVAEYERYEHLMSGALRAQEFEKLSDLRVASRRIGTLAPVFLHDPGEKVMDIYPTVPTDIGQMVKIGRVVQTFLREEGPLPAS